MELSGYYISTLQFDNEPHSNYRLTTVNNEYVELFVDWTVLPDNSKTNFSTVSDKIYNIISLDCYVNDNRQENILTTHTDKITNLESVLTEHNEEHTSADRSVFIRNQFLPKTSTKYSEETLQNNVNMCYKLIDIEYSDTTVINVYSGYSNNYSTENIFFLDSEYNVISVDGFLKDGKEFIMPVGTEHIVVCFLYSYPPFGIQIKMQPQIINSVIDAARSVITSQIQEQMSNIELPDTTSTNDYLSVTSSHIERTLRDFCYDEQRRNPFTWKTFDKKWFAFMNDDALATMGDYYNVCRVRRVPYCHAFILNRQSTYTFTGNDANRTNLIKNPAIGEEYEFLKESTQTYLRLYIDRQYELGFPINITINGTEYVLTSADDARIQIGSGTEVTFTITNMGSTTKGRTNFINVIATADATDSASSTSVWTVQQMVKNIVFDFGEILAHSSPVINMWDLKQVEQMLANCTYEIPRKIDELLEEEHVKGGILAGGPNSDRGMYTEIGQRYCCRYLLYADYWGTSPQYTITRYSFGNVIGSQSEEIDYDTAKSKTLTWLNNHSNGFYPLFTHQEKKPNEIAAVIDAILQTEGCVCSTWRRVYEQNS